MVIIKWLVENFGLNNTWLLAFCLAIAAAAWLSARIAKDSYWGKPIALNKLPWGLYPIKAVKQWGKSLLVVVFSERLGAMRLVEVAPEKKSRKYSFAPHLSAANDLISVSRKKVKGSRKVVLIFSKQHQDWFHLFKPELEGDVDWDRAEPEKLEV